MHDSKLVYQFAANSLSDKLNFKMKYRKTVHFYLIATLVFLVYECNQTFGYKL